MYGFQAEGAAPIVLGRKVSDPHTVATAIRIGDPASWKSAVAARDESGGAIEAVSDEEIVAAHRDIAAHEGIFCEPASAASIAGLRKRARARGTHGLRRVVCVLTGNGLKDQENVGMSARNIEVDATAAAVRDALAMA
jgi:threonine synthase